ncbi:transporter [Streptomyces nanshensis]|nr:transporter [Streptomyces nanshensis]
MEGASSLKLFTVNGAVAEVSSRLAVRERELHQLVGANLETMLGVRFLASEYSTGSVHGGRIDTLGIDESGAPVVLEYKRGVDAGVINQGLYYLSWLVDHKAEFEALVRGRLGPIEASQVLWSAPRLICIAAGFSRYDVHAVREHRRSIDLVSYRFLGSHHFALETVASVGRQSTPHRATALPEAGGKAQGRTAGGSLAELREAVGEVLSGLGDDVKRIDKQTYRAYRRTQHFACVCPPQETKLLVYLKANPKKVDLIPDFTRDVTERGHHGTGNLEVALRTERDLERAGDLFRLSYDVS